MSSAGRKTKKKTLDLAGFLRLLKKAKRKWGVNYDDNIRCQRGDCPIVAVARSLDPKGSYRNSFYTQAADFLWMSDALAERIVDAADNRGSYPTRKKLLAACGIKSK